MCYIRVEITGERGWKLHGQCKSGKEPFWDVWVVWNLKKQAGDSNVSNRITEYRRSGLPGNLALFYEENI